MESGTNTHVYSESGWKADVELLDEKTGAHGTTYTMRVIKTHMRPDLDPEAIPKDGEIFTAFRSHGTKIQGWTLGGQ